MSFGAMRLSNAYRPFLLAYCGLFALVTVSVAKSEKGSEPLPSRFIIGRDSFFDFGPPFHYFEVISVERNQNGARVSRILVTPLGDKCLQPAQLEWNTTFVPESVGTLLEGLNPCTIPEKALLREQKRCKHCLTFSGVDITMQLSCGTKERQTRMDILDRDMYDSGRAKTPEHTSWTMRLLGHLNQALGPGAMEKPAFATANTINSIAPSPEGAEIKDLAAGKSDSLFSQSTFRLSDLYLQALHSSPQPPIELVSSQPTAPISYSLPRYPPLARVAQISGRVRFTAQVGPDGHLFDIKVLDGHPLLKQSIESSASHWVYPAAESNSLVTAIVEFRRTCLAQ